MFFATYIKNLHDCIEPKTNRGEFTKKILELIVTNPKKVLHYKSMSSYYNFYDGKTQGKGDNKKIIGDMICNCAKNCVCYLDVSDEKTNRLPRFKNYLKELKFNLGAKKQLCDSFRCELPNINTDNYIDELSELLINVIKDAANNRPKGTFDPSIDKLDSNELQIKKQVPVSGPQKTKTLIEDVAVTLDSLFSTGFDIATERNQVIEIILSKKEEEKDFISRNLELSIHINKNQNNFRTDYITNEAIKKYEKKLNELFDHFTNLGEQIRNKARETGNEKYKMISHYMDNIVISIFTEDSILKDYAFIPSKNRKDAYKLQRLLSELLSEESGIE